MTVRLFVSHSEADEKLVAPLARWLQAGLGLKSHELRCTVLGDLGPGGTAEAVLREDLRTAEAVVGLLTANSLRSHWVQLEIGAGWLQGRLHPIRGPGIDPKDLPKPISDFVNVGYCEKTRMLGLLKQLAEQLGVSPQDGIEDELDAIRSIAEGLLAEDRVRWFALPPVLSASRLDSSRFVFVLQSLCRELGLDVQEALSCTTPQGKVNRDPEELPVWARDLWSVSKNAVNLMLRPRRTPETEQDVPDRVLSPELIAEMTRALGSRRGRAEQMGAWFENASSWIATNTLSTSRG
jgi:hypothetical protein